MTHIYDYLVRNAQERGQKAALIYNEQTTTWRALHAQVEAVAASLEQRLSKKRQEVVALLLPNSPAFVVAYLAIIRAGHIALPLDPAYKKLEIDSIMRQIDPALAITDVAGAPLFKQPVLAETLMEAPAPAEATAFLQLPAERQVATMLFTSGTTGKPKATQYTHANHMWNITAVSDLWQWTESDTLLLSLPLSHWHGLVMVLAGALYHANTVHIHERFDAESTLNALSSGAISLFMHVPIAYLKMVGVARPERYDLSKVRLCISGSSYLPPAVWYDFQRLYGHDILERYGSSETGLIASNLLSDRQPGSVGYVLPGVTVQTQPGGELAMRSPGLFTGYYRNDEATRKNTTKGNLWLTGDIGEFAPNGRLVLKGRLIEKIKKLGYTVYPRDVEWALLQSPLIRDVVAVGIQEEGALSDTLVYFVVGAVTRQQITDFAKTNLPAAWRPDRIVLLDEIPKTRSGKPERPKLLAQVGAA